MLRDPVTIFFEIVVLLFAISVHESAHAWMANRLADQTPKCQDAFSLIPWFTSTCSAPSCCRQCSFWLAFPHLDTPSQPQSTTAIFGSLCGMTYSPPSPDQLAISSLRSSRSSFWL